MPVSLLFGEGVDISEGAAPPQAPPYCHSEERSDEESVSSLSAIPAFLYTPQGSQEEYNPVIFPLL